jgi:hypothetical protein
MKMRKQQLNVLSAADERSAKIRIRKETEMVVVVTGSNSPSPRPLEAAEVRLRQSLAALGTACPVLKSHLLMRFATHWA